jgi:uncharacterized protein involved in response to NO
MFTNNAVPGARATRNARLELAALASLPVLVGLEIAGLEDAATVVALAAALLHGARLALWRPWKAFRKPILWILHVSYAWLVAHLALRGLAGLGLVGTAFATHALTVGAIGGLTLGMMTRSALGHTGRPLASGPAETSAYVLVQAAAVSRVVLPLLYPAGYLGFVVLAAVFWIGAFAVFTAAYAPILVRPRVDGLPG